MSLTGDKLRRANSWANEHMKLVSNPDLSKTEKREYEIPVESMLVDWGVAPAVASKSPDYHGICKPLAYAAVQAE